MAAIWVHFENETVESSRSLADPLSVSAKALDFGEVPLQANFQWTLPLRNTTRRDVFILGFESSCACTSIKPDQFVIPAEETRKVFLTLDLTREKGSNWTSSMRDFVVNVQAHVAAPVSRHVDWSVRGKIRIPFLVEPPFVRISAVRNTPSPVGTVTVIPTDPVRDLRANCDPALGSVEVVGRSLDGERRFLVKFTPAGTLESGRFDSFFYLEAVDQDGSLLPRVPLPVECVVTQEVAVSPERLHFGVRQTGESADQLVRLFSKTGQTFTCEKLETDNADVVVEPVQHSTDGDPPFRILQHFSQPGHNTSRVRFIVKLNESAETIEVEVPIYYYGVKQGLASRTAR